MYNKSVENLASWKLENEYTAVYAVQGHRPSMEDRFVVNERIGDSDVSLFAIFDGHGGEVNFELQRVLIIKRKFILIVCLIYFVSVCSRLCTR